MTSLRRWSWLGLCALAVFSGCNITSLPFFLMGGESKVQAKWHQLAAKDKEKKVRVVVLVASNLPVREQLAKVDREVAQRVETHLRQLFKDNEENVEVVPMLTVDRYKGTHPEWDNPLDLVKIGQDLKVKYVIYLEMNKMSLFVEGSSRQLYQGDVEIDMTLVNVLKGPDEIPDRKQLHEKYPSTAIDASDDPNPVGFRSKLLDRLAKKIAWEFTAHPTEDDFGDN